MRIVGRSIIGLACGILVWACSEDAPVEKPDPDPLTRAAIGYFCGMVVVDHAGPKGQIFVDGNAQPLWFTSVRDTLAYTRLPEETDKISAIYVNDMSTAVSWNEPGDAWVNAQDAFYVLGSSQVGGMGASEAVPFSRESDARDFSTEFGGSIFQFDDIPEDALLGDAISVLHSSQSHMTGE